jgi:hypothetical protein
MGVWFWVFVVWFVISTNLLTFLLTYLFLQKKMYLLAVREIILFLTTGGRGVEKTEKAEKTEKKSEVEKKEQKEAEKQETPHSFSTSSPSPHFSLQDLLLKKNK